MTDLRGSQHDLDQQQAQEAADHDADQALRDQPPTVITSNRPIPGEWHE